MTPFQGLPEVPVLSVSVDDRTSEITVHELQAHGSHTIGTFTDVAKAWAAIDQYDAPVQTPEPVAAAETTPRRSRFALKGARRRTPIAA